MQLQVFFLNANFKYWHQRVKFFNHLRLNHNLTRGDNFADKNRKLASNRQVSIWLKDQNGIYKKAHIGQLDETKCNLIFRELDIEGVAIDGKIHFENLFYNVKFDIKRIKAFAIVNSSVDSYLEKLTYESIEDLNPKNILIKNRTLSVTDYLNFMDMLPA